MDFSARAPLAVAGSVKLTRRAREVLAIKAAGSPGAGKTADFQEWHASCLGSDWTLGARITVKRISVTDTARWVIGGVLIAGTTHLLLSRLNLMEHWAAVTKKYEYLQVDELPLVFAVLAVYVAILLHREVRAKRRLNACLKSEIVQRRLAEDDLRMAMSARDGFFAGMSHDLRTPVNSIMGFSDMMRNHVFGGLGHDKYEEYAEDIHRAACLLDATISQILDVAKIKSEGDLIVREEQFCMAEEIRYCCKLVSGWNGKHREIDLDLGRHEELITFDRLLFRRFMFNLLSNAVKYAGTDAEIGVTLRSGGVRRGLELTVRDNGIGIDAHRLDEARMQFKQISNAVPYMDGAGLGLWIVSKIAEAHGCPLNIRSARGEGCRVTLSIPPARVAAAKAVAA